MEKLIIGKNGFETVRYDSPDSLLYVRRSRLSAFDEMRVESHRHEDIEFNVALSGSMTYRVGSETVVLSEGRGIMVNSARRHSVFAHDGGDCEFLVILMNPAFLCTTKHIEDTYVLPVTRPEARDFVELDPRVGWQSDIISKLRDIWTSYADGRDALRIAEIFFSLWHAVYANITPPCREKRQERRRAQRQTRGRTPRPQRNARIRIRKLRSENHARGHSRGGKNMQKQVQRTVRQIYALSSRRVSDRLSDI